MTPKRVGCVVCIFLGFLLVGLVLQVAADVRARGQTTECANNLKQIGLGVHNYHDSYRRFPSPIYKAFRSEKDAGLPPEKSIGWMYSISPFVESRMDSRLKVDEKKPWDDEENRYAADDLWLVYQCPVQVRRGLTRNYSSYLGIAGVGADAAWLLKEDPNIGVFGYRRNIKMDDITDGAAFTFLMMETATDNGPWISAGFSTVRGLDPEGAPYLGEEGQFSSSHAGQTNCAFADGSVRAFSATLGPKLFEAMATIRGGEKVEFPD
ncbi:MAG: DUF1559 domain-containing protein [Planctomycetes bacterium]|nr:DUF1559 domain-containing protein [Planctomycetota bacterium]